MVKEEYKLNEKGLFDIYDYFKLLRNDSKLSQRNVCEYLGVTNVSLCRYEKKERLPIDPCVIFKYCKLLGITDEVALEFYRILCNRESNFQFDINNYKINKNGNIDEIELLKLGKYFLNERIDRDLTQRDVSETTGLSIAEISRVESLKRELPTLNSIIPLCKFYNISDDEFVEFYIKIMGIERKKSIYISSDIEFLEQTIKSQAIIIKEQQEMIEQLNKQLSLVKTRR